MSSSIRPPRNLNEFQFHKSSKNESEFYIIGIIDYFQEYNLSKAMEKKAKQILKFDSNLDTSA